MFEIILSVSTSRSGENVMGRHKNGKSRPNKSYKIVKEGSTTKRPERPGLPEREPQSSETTLSESSDEEE